MSKSDKPATKPVFRLDAVRTSYERFVKSGGSTRANVNDLLKAIVEALTNEDAYSQAAREPE